MSAQYVLRGSHYIVQTSQASQPSLCCLIFTPGLAGVFYLLNILSVGPVVRVLAHLVVGGPESRHHPCHCLELAQFLF